jgi:2-methylcitrate dehydratase PrpD
MVDDAYRVAFTDWLACACAGAGERAATAVRAGGEGVVADVAFAATAGHVLDYDDTLADGIAHVSATTAPAALAVAAHLNQSLAHALDAYAEGFEAMGALAVASHPALYDAGWHPTAVCGPVGAAVAASRLLGLHEAQRQTALAVAVLRAGGTRGAFGSDAKAIQVGLAAATGVQAALMAQAGAVVDPAVIHGPLGFEAVLGASWPSSDAPSPRAIERNWIKLHPSCLGTHSPIDGAAQAREAGYRLNHDRLDVVVHPVARQAAHLDVVRDGLGAKFSIPYCVAHTLTHGPPRVRDFSEVDTSTVERSGRISVVLDESLPQFGAVLRAGDRELARVPCPQGAPERPADAAALADKISDLAGGRLTGVLDDLRAPAATALAALQLPNTGRRSATVAESRPGGGGDPLDRRDPVPLGGLPAGQHRD